MAQTQHPNSAMDEENIRVQQAGIVLLNDYIPMLFERLGLIGENRKFISVQSQHYAVASLYHLASGITTGVLPISTATDQATKLLHNNKTLIYKLIQAAIDYWRTIGNTSVEEFRGNWLIREGLLIAQKETGNLS